LTSMGLLAFWLFIVSRHSVRYLLCSWRLILLDFSADFL
jgi:hypothetical protein